VARALRACLDALGYFTVLPAGRRDARGAPDAYALSFLPAIGMLVGALAGAAGYGAYALFHASWAFAVAWAAAIGLSGAIHVDGFLDACDGLFATATPQRRLEIMRDPRHGTYAIVGMAVLAAFWLLALAPTAPARLPLLLAWSGATARLAVLPDAWIFPYAGGGATAPAFAARPNWAVVLASFAASEALAWFVSPYALAAVPVAAGLAIAGGAWCARRLGGGLNGDVYGALVVTLEVLALLAATLLR
jgi:adenosylcobinamide-GDP ribazoletransferase